MSKVSTNVNPDNVWAYRGNNGKGFLNANIDGTGLQNIIVDLADNDKPIHELSLLLSSNSYDNNLANQRCQDQQQLQVNQDLALMIVAYFIQSRKNVNQTK